MKGKGSLQDVYKDMMNKGGWWSVGQLTEEHGLTISQRDYLRQSLYGETTGHSTSYKKLDGIAYYKINKPGVESFAQRALGFKPTSASTFMLKHG